MTDVMLVVNINVPQVLELEGALFLPPSFCSCIVEQLAPLKRYHCLKKTLRQIDRGTTDRMSINNQQYNIIIIINIMTNISLFTALSAVLSHFHCKIVISRIQAVCLYCTPPHCWAPKSSRQPTRDPTRPRPLYNSSRPLSK